MGNDTKNRNSELIAKRWTAALLDLVQEDKTASKDKILKELKEIDETISGSKELSDILNNPAISGEEKQSVLSKLFEKRYSGIVYNFLTTLNSKGRLGIIGSVTEDFQKKLEEQKNILRVGITSAIELSDNKKNEISGRIAEKLQKDIIPEWSVNSAIIGGLVFNINETIIDNSIKHRLENLSKYIIKG